MPGTGITTVSLLRPALALVATLCLLLAGQVVHSNPYDSITPRVDAKTLRDGLSLKGQWRFQPGDDLAWAAPGLADSEWGFMSVPGRWPAGGYPETGQLAWYRLTLQLDSSLWNESALSSLAVRLGKVLNAYELYAGGELVGGVGKLPPLSEVAYDKEQVFQVPASAVDETGRLVLALRVWGGKNTAVQAWSAGPALGEYTLGEYRPLLLSGFISELPGLLFCALIFAFGCYHLYLYARNRTLDTYLWFGLAALNIALYGLMLTQWKYLSDFSFLAMKKIEFGTIYLFPAIGIQLVWSLLQIPISRWLRAYQLSFVAASLMVVAVPGSDIHYHSLHLEQIWTLPILAFAPYTILREARAGNAEARTVAVGTLLFLATCINDLLIDLAHFETVRLAPAGFVAILISMAVSLANRFTNMYSALESEVAERTAELSNANELLVQMARVDHLTGLLNRRGFAEEAETETRRVFRSGKTFSLILADVDNFKQFNDKHGHVCGDHVLKRAAALLQESVRDVDCVARWGGEEFIMLLPETDAEGAAVVAEKLRQAIAGNLFEFDGSCLGITMTFGIAGHRKGEPLDTCIARADTALYHGKERGRNKVMMGNYKGLTLVN